jgi:transposase
LPLNSLSRFDCVHLGMDVSKHWIAVGVLEPDAGEAVVDKIAHDEPSVRRLIGRFPDTTRLRVCYEAGPTGYDLYRLLRSMSVSCEVVAPSLIPKAPTDRVKTDRRDARRLARLHRAGELTAIRVPTVVEEGVRDLCRARADVVEDRRRARQRLSAFLLRHNRIYPGPTAWTIKHRDWLDRQRFDEPATAATYGHYLSVVEMRDSTMTAIDAELAGWFDREPFAGPVSRLAAYRGVDRLGGLSLAAEVGDWRRFPTAGAFMAFCGLVPSEYSTGDRTRRGRLTNAGNVHIRTQLVEGAWAYQYRAAVPRHLAKRHEGVPADTIARSWKAQQRLCRRYQALAARKPSNNTVAAAVARELAGFLWAEMQH